jgi:hypothetical protein
VRNGIQPEPHANVQMQISRFLVFEKGMNQASGSVMRLMISGGCACLLRTIFKVHQRHNQLGLFETVIKFHPSRYAAMTGNPVRLRVLALYKELHRLGRDYPDPS